MFFENIVDFCFLENKKISIIAKFINMTNFYSIYQTQDNERHWNKMIEIFNKIFFNVDYFTDPFPFKLELISEEFLIKFSSNGYICCVTNSDRLKNPHNIIFYVIEYFYQRIFDVTKIQSNFIENKLCFILNDNVEYIVDEKTIGQSTGLFDKNGKEIFINDIIHFKANYGSYTLELQTATVGFDELNGRLAVKMNGNVLALCDMNYTNVEYEILGNIWTGDIKIYGKKI